MMFHRPQTVNEEAVRSKESPTYSWAKNESFCIDAKTWVVAILGVILLQVFVKKYRLGSLSKSRLPPGPSNWPLIGALFSLEPNLHRCFTKLARKFGPIFYYQMSCHSVMVISSVKGAEEVTKIKDVEFADTPNRTIPRSLAKYLNFEAQKVSMASYDDRQRMLKKLCTREFFTASKLANYENIRGNEGATMIEEIRRKIENGGSGTTINVRESLRIMATNVMCFVFLGKRYSDTVLESETDGVRDVPEVMKRFGELFIQLNPTDLFPSLEWFKLVDPRRLRVRYKEYHKLARNCCSAILEEHRQVRRSVKIYKDRDLVDFLLTLHETGKITEATAMACILDVLGEGIDTNVASIEWALLELVKHPETLAKLQTEINEVVGSRREVEESDYARMPFLQAIVRETFRLHPPVPLLIPRLNKFPATLQGFDVPANTTVFVNASAIARNPHLWEHPDEFKPERFMGRNEASSSASLSIDWTDCKLMPFGSGRRMCPGYSLGLLLVQRGISSLVHAFEWTPPIGLSIDDVSTEEGVGVVCLPKEPLCLSATLRLGPNVYTSRTF